MANKKPVLRAKMKGRPPTEILKVPNYIDPVDVAFIYDQEVSKRTPIDTGQARAGWEVEEKTNGNVWVENMVEYVQYLEDGHSRQAPNGFIQQAKAATIRKMRTKSPYVRKN